MSPAPQTRFESAEPAGPPAVGGRIDACAAWMCRGGSWRIRAPLLACLALDLAWSLWCVLLAVAALVAFHALAELAKRAVAGLERRGWACWPAKAMRSWGSLQDRALAAMPRGAARWLQPWEGVVPMAGNFCFLALAALSGSWMGWLASMAAGRALAIRPDLAPAALASGRNPLLLWRCGAVASKDLTPWFVESESKELRSAPGPLRRYALMRPQLGDALRFDVPGWRPIHSSPHLQGSLDPDWLASARGWREREELAALVDAPARASSPRRI